MTRRPGPRAGTRSSERAARRGQPAGLGRGPERRALLVGRRRRPGAVGGPRRQRHAVIGEALLLRVGELQADRRAGRRIRGHRDRRGRVTGRPHASAAALSARALLVGRAASAGCRRPAAAGSVTPWSARHCFWSSVELRVRPGRPVGSGGASGGAGAVVVGGTGERSEAGDGQTGDDHGAEDHSPGADGSALEGAGPVLLGVVHVRSCR